MSDLANRVTAVIPHKWNQVAIQLQLSTGERKAIEKDKMESSERFMCVLEHWERSCTLPYTWETLIAVLKSASVGEQELADQLHRDFC